MGMFGFDAYSMYFLRTIIFLFNIFLILKIKDVIILYILKKNKKMDLFLNIFLKICIVIYLHCAELIKI